MECLGHTLSRQISRLQSFLGTVQFYGKFIPNLLTMTDSLSRLTCRDIPWKCREEQQAAFQHLKTIFNKDTILVHYDPHLDIGISSEASNVGIGTMLFHYYPYGCKRPIANASKKLSPTQRRYTQIQREALAVIFGLKNCHHFLYKRKFILVTDHKALVAMFYAPKGTPTITTNRLA